MLLLQATNQELAKAQRQTEAQEMRAQQLEEEKVRVEQQAADLSKQKEQLQLNNTKLVLTNVMLLNKAKHLEDSSRALVAKQEDLQHQVGTRAHSAALTSVSNAIAALMISSFKYGALGMCQILCLCLRMLCRCLRTFLLPQQLEQLQRERQAELEASEATLAALKDQVTGVLNRYLSKDIELQTALQEMQALGIELVPLDAQGGRCGSKSHKQRFGQGMSVCFLRCASADTRSSHACLHW
jgi:hypothetical protein